MNVKEAYNIWSEQYDTNENKTRDLEAISLRQNLKEQKFGACLEIGCGTGKNTEWLVSIADNILAVDLSEEMLAKAKQKITSENVKFVQADINKEWSFTDNKKFDLATFSLVLEHIENLDIVFQRLNEVINLNGTIYIGELHPFKQYNGTKARFETADGLQVVTCFNHNISDFVHSAKKYNFQLIDINEYFDEDDKNTLPRILTMLFKKN
ncbi:MAG: class I SAM-dependent methyltransferase [Pedobacter sp.]|jgi:ubiquinone/menaquinone biosynthesis C-methylase UbiE|uniref:class I SAM-dependent methyltransferase n=1 Tax=Pedobacter sp. TaxID=1411316 RepID=UPI003562EF63